MWQYVVIGGLALLILLHNALELHYFLRMGLTVLLARFCRKKVNILDTTTFTGICLTTDVDALLFHMNNARYLRELDFAKVDFCEKTGLLSAIQSKGGAIFQGATTIRYRRFIRPFSIYHIKSRIIYWEGDSIYMEHKFITPKDNFVRAVVMGKQRLVGVTSEEVITSLGSGSAKGGVEAGPLPPLPQPPPELTKWIESNAISSSSLRSH